MDEKHIRQGRRLSRLPDGWTARDLQTLVTTAGEIASHYGTGTDGLDRDDVLSSRQRAVLAHAARDYRAGLGEDDEPENNEQETRP